MESIYSEEDHLLLSGIQHMAFCERQWALIHIEQAWAENVRTLEGKFLHERADDSFGDETRKDIRVVRAMPLVSHRLGLRGVADVVEFYRTSEVAEEVTVRLKNRTGRWRPYPVEYKRGRPKRDDRDAVQLCAQAMALEEMLGVSIETGYLYYHQIRHREHIVIDRTLRLRVELLARQMHDLMAQGKTPQAVKGKHCSLCSLIEICQPRLTIRQRPVKNYLARMVDLEVKDN
jgi:CRISPR-associated exonuclease Cas4